jgi:hypothetical protein
MNNLVTRTLIRALSLAFVTSFSLMAHDVPAHDATKQAPKIDVFAAKEWKENATTLENLMGIDLKKAMQGIHAMYSAKAHAEKNLTEAAEVRAGLSKAASKNVAAKTEELLKPVKSFLPEIRQVNHLVIPLVKISLDRELLDNEIDFSAGSNAAALSYESSIFKKFMETKEPVEKFIASTVKTEEDFTELCREFQRVFSDLVHHAFPTLTKSYEKMINDAKKRKEELAGAR